MGLFHYHLDHLSTVTRFLSSLLITGADREKGLKELELASQKGDLLKDLALAELASVYTYLEDKPERALPIALELRKRFPRNYGFAFALASTLAEVRRFAEAFTVAAEIGEGIAKGVAPYVPQLQSRYDHLLGRIFFNQREYAKATEHFRKVFTDTSVFSVRTRASALLHLG